MKYILEGFNEDCSVMECIIFSDFGNSVFQIYFVDRSKKFLYPIHQSRSVWKRFIKLGYKQIQ